MSASWPRVESSIFIILHDKHKKMIALLVLALVFNIHRPFPLPLPTSTTENGNPPIPIQSSTGPISVCPLQTNIYSSRLSPTSTEAVVALRDSVLLLVSLCLCPTHASCSATRMCSFLHIFEDPRVETREKREIQEHISDSCLSFVPFSDLTYFSAERSSEDNNPAHWLS